MADWSPGLALLPPAAWFIAQPMTAEGARGGYFLERVPKGGLAVFLLADGDRRNREHSASLRIDRFFRLPLMLRST